MNNLTAHAPVDGRRSQVTGDTAAESGIYRLLHTEHGSPREFIFIRGMKFPACPHCNAPIEFELMMAAPYIGDDPDFAKLS